MKKKDFDNLKQSVIETGLMMRGKLKPSREFTRQKDRKNAETFETWAICITNEDEELVPLKLYKIEVYPHLSKVAVTDEEGETLVCPQDYFLPVKFEEEEKINNFLKKVA